MLNPGDRRLFFELLRPPLGYRFDEAIGTTFSLDLVTLLTVPLAFTQFEWGDADGKPASNPPLLLEAIRRNADRLTVFCQAGRAFAPALHGSLLTYLEGSVVEVTAPAEHGIFHPKVWLVRYLDEEGRVFYRLACLTRNLTGDTSWDLSVVLEGELAERENGFSVNRPLERFFATLPDLAVQRADPVTLERARRMADEVRKVRFKGPADFDSVAFWPMGIDGVKRDPLPDQWTRALYVAPFVSASFLDRFDLSGDILVSRQEELDKLEPQVLHDLEKIYVLAPAAVADAPDEADGPDAESGLSGLHAKLYVFDMGWETAVLVGSANATGAAFERNVEFLVELRGKKSKVGIDQVLAQAPGQAGLIDLLSEYSPPAEPAPLDELGQELEAVVDQTRLVLAKAGLRARVDAEDEGLFALTLMPAGSPTLPDGVSAAVWPVTLPAETNTKPFVGGEPIRFGAVPLVAVTSFFAFELTARRGDRTYSAQCVLNLPLDNAPEGRREAVLRSLLDDPEKFIQFLQFLLGGDELLLAADGDEMAGNFAGSSWQSQPFVVFESLLRTLRDDPARLDLVASLVDDLASSLEGAKALPDGFMGLWSSIWAARKEIEP